MNPGGDAAETMFRMILNGTEVIVKLTGSGAKNLAVILYRYYQGDKKIKGAVNLTKLLKSGDELTIAKIGRKDLVEFKNLSNKYGIVYSAVKDTRTNDGMCDVFFKKKDLAKVEHVVGKMDMTGLSHEKEHIFNNPEKELEKTIDENGDVQLKKEPQQRSVSSMQNSRLPIKTEQADIPRLINEIKAGNKKAITSENWKSFLAMNASMYVYSLGNQNRIFEQSPNASVVLSKTKWRELGRYPQSGAPGLRITVPEIIDGEHTGNYVDAKVYDISETYGKNNPEYDYNLKENKTALGSEIERLKSSSPVPVEVKDNVATDSFYNSEDNKIYLRSDISNTEQYIGLVKEIQYANAHKIQGKSYDRADNHFIAESVAYSMAVKYGLDTEQFRFDCLNEVVTNLDDKDIGKLVENISLVSRNEIKKAETNIDKFKNKERLSVVSDLKAHKKAIDNGSYKAKKPIPFPKKPKGRDR